MAGYEPGAAFEAVKKILINSGERGEEAVLAIFTSVITMARVGMGQVGVARARELYDIAEQSVQDADADSSRVH